MSDPSGSILDPALATLTRYFRALDRFDLDEVIDCLSEDVAYGHPQVQDWKPELTVPVLHGRENVREFMLDHRKSQDSEHRFTGYGRGFVAPGPDLEGDDFYFAAVTGRNANYITSCVIVFEVDAENRISRYSPHVGPPSYNHQSASSYLSSFLPGVVPLPRTKAP